jgi:hypothetical protein
MLAAYADVPPHVGAYIGRWAEPLATGWDRGTGWTVRHVGWLAERPDVAVELLVTLEVRYAQLASETLTGRAREHIEEVTYAHAALADLVEHAGLRSALADRAAWEGIVDQVLFAVDAAAVATAPVAPPLAAGLSGAALAAGGAEAAGVSPTSWIVERFTQRPDAIPDVLAAQAADRDAAGAAMEHIALVAAVHDFAVRHPHVRVPSPPAPMPQPRADPRPDEAANRVSRDLHARVGEWIDDLRTAGEPALARLADEIEPVIGAVRTALLDAGRHVAA